MTLDNLTREIIDSFVAEMRGSESISGVGGAISATPVYTTVVDARDATEYVFFVKNTTNQSVTSQLEASWDPAFSDAYTVSGQSLVTASSTNGVISFTQYYPYLRLKLTGAGATSSGAVSIHVSIQKGG